MNDKILGHDWADIQRAQQGGRLAHAIDTSKPPTSDATPDDLALLERHGIDGLRALGFWGVLDRLQRAGTVCHCPRCDDDDHTHFEI